MQQVAITGVSGPLGRRLSTMLDRAGVQRVVGVETADLADSEIRSVLGDVDTVVHLAWDEALGALDGAPDGVPDIAPDTAVAANIESTRRLLDAAATTKLKSFVLLSSATVYGAWADNPVPITEDAPLRPNRDFLDGVHHAEAERLTSDFAADHPSTAVAVMRAVPVLGRGLGGRLTRALGGGAPLRVMHNDPPRQFLHLDDLADALALAACTPLSGTWNVAPDGWIPGDAVRSLTGGRPPVPVPARFAPVVASALASLHLSEAPLGLLALVEHPWVVANDRLRAAGWEPLYTNEEALVAGRPGSRWTEMSPRRRQEVALVLAGGGLLGIGACVARSLRRRWRDA